MILDVAGGASTWHCSASVRVAEPKIYMNGMTGRACHFDRPAARFDEHLLLSAPCVCATCFCSTCFCSTCFDSMSSSRADRELALASADGSSFFNSLGPFLPHSPGLGFCEAQSSPQ